MRAHTPFIWASSEESPINSSGSSTANGSSPTASRAHPTAWPRPARVVLVGDRDPPVATDAGEPVGGVVVALVAQHRDDVVVALEVALDRRLGVAADDDDVIDPGPQRLVDDELDRRRVADRHQLLGHRLGRWEEPGARSGSRDDRTAHLHRPHHR